MRLICILVILLPVLSLAWSPAAVSAQLLLNEAQNSNIYGIVDEDNDTSDWIELLNAGATALSLSGYGLSDDPSDPFKWVFPDVVIDPGEHLLVWASGKDRRHWPRHWETIVDWGDDWSYKPLQEELPTDWRSVGFDDSEWQVGPSGFGRGDDDDATYIIYVRSCSLRRSIMIEDPSQISLLCLHVDYDDGFVAWINDVEIGRGNIGVPGDYPAWNDVTTSFREAQIYQGGKPDTWLIAGADSILQPGENVIAIQFHNVALANSDMSLIPFVTLGLDSVPPGGGEGVPPMLDYIIPHLHTNFSLSSSGETLTLCDSLGLLVDSVFIGGNGADVSVGRAPDGGENWVVFSEPSPEAVNPESGYAGIATPPEFSVTGGFFLAPITLELDSPVSGAQIYYTYDGWDPSDSTQLYESSLPIVSSAIVRARAYEPGKLPSPIVTHSYLFDGGSTLPVFSIVTDPDNLWDEDYGIYAFGDDGQPNFPYYGANFWEDWERVAHVEYWEQGGSLTLRQDIGIKIHGGTSRGHPQKSLRLVAHGGYGESSLAHRFFPQLELNEFKFLLLRNAGSDWSNAHLRDGFLHELTRGYDLGQQAYRPAVVFLNGEYWGIQNMRERAEENFLAAHYGIDPDEVDLLKDRWIPVEGDPYDYLDMIDYVETHSLADSVHFAHIQARMDTDIFALYNIFEVYFANTDWPYGNTRYWRSRGQNGYWRWMLKDLDLCLGLYDSINHNTLAWALDDNGGDGNPPWSTFLFRSLMENNGFRRDFINAYAELLSTRLLPQSTNSALNATAAEIEPEMARHTDRWGSSVVAWQAELSELRHYLNERPGIAKDHILAEFGLADTMRLSVEIDPPQGGTLALTAIDVAHGWIGTYFLGNDISLRAVPAPGYAFSGWSDAGQSSQADIILPADGDQTITAYFSLGGPGMPDVIINEINYHSAGTFDPGDWIELHNPGSTVMDIENWIFKDSDNNHAFSIPPGTVIPAGGYLVLCENLDAFQALFPEVDAVIGNTGFGFSGGGELLRLFTADGVLYDSLVYDDAPPWPTEPDGGGPTLELIYSDLDNSLPESWAASVAPFEHGSPGERNSVYSLTGVAENTLPSRFTLLNPRPNPFNPVTSLRFGLPESKRVRLSIHDVRGRRVAILVEGQLDAGWHERSWRPDGFASGVYLARLEIGGHFLSRKLILLK